MVKKMLEVCVFRRSVFFCEREKFFDIELFFFVFNITENLDNWVTLCPKFSVWKLRKSSIFEAIKNIQFLRIRINYNLITRILHICTELRLYLRERFMSRFAGEFFDVSQALGEERYFIFGFRG